ncbi:MAG TPA: 3,4-dihydroxy-2-butanone-4-phosphate synthase [Planctomycetaceae bacterium]|nr:3,4-dihydroxy-2-butanone-4-phosphate synthase [Planctomycetaceae bacterium]
MPKFSRVEAAIEALANGQLIIVTDAEDRENEGDFLGAAEKATAETIHFMISAGRGQLCMPIVPETARRLDLRPIVPPQSKAMPCFATPIDHGMCTTGISPQERAFTLRKIVDTSSCADDFVRPGHIFPLIAREGGVLERPGHTEAAIDLMRMGGLAPAAVLCEICSRDGRHMAHDQELMEIAQAFSLPIITIDAVISFREKSGYACPQIKPASMASPAI